MAAPIKADVIYYNTPSDFELEFNICGCCTMRLLSTKPQTQKDFLRSLSVAVGRSQIILAIGTLEGDGNMLSDLCAAIGFNMSKRDLSAFGINSPRLLPERSIPLVTSSGEFGGCVIECGPQAIIALSDDKALRHTIMRELVHDYVRDFERNLKRAEAQKRATLLKETAELENPTDHQPKIGDPYVIKEEPKPDFDFTELENEFINEEEHKKKGFWKHFLTFVFILIFIAAGLFAYVRFAEPMIIDNLYSKYREMHGKPHALLESTMLDSMGELYAENADTVGFVSVDGTNIAYPVVYGEAKENNYYQNHLFNGFYSYIHGTPYTVNNIKEDSYFRNTIIFGKDNHPDIMFGPLSGISTLSGYHNSHIVRFDTLYSSGVYKIFAVIKSEMSLDGKLLQTEFVDDTAFLNYVEMLREQSDINTTVEVLGSDEVITLVSYGREGQTLVAARRIREGESELIDTQSATNKGETAPDTEKSDNQSNTVSVLPIESTAFTEFSNEYEQSAPLDAETAAQNASAFAKTEEIKPLSTLTKENAEEVLSSQILTVTDASNGEKVTGSTVDILCRIVEAEMGSKFESEALKAQAIASYGWLLTNSAASGGAPAVRLKTPQLKTTEAVRAVLGLKPYYETGVAQTLYFPYSAGYTADSKNVYGIDVGYKPSESSVDKNLDGFITRRSYKASDINKWVKDATGIDLSSVADKNRWINLAYDQNGTYVSHVWFGNDNGFYNARLLREKILSKQNAGDDKLLLSTSFKISYQSESDTFLFEVRGCGHGVGMSQYGANALAQSGMSYEEIFAHYYDGIEINY